MSNCWEIGELGDFDSLVLDIGQALLAAPKATVERWQSINVQSRPESQTRELTHARIHIKHSSAAQGYTAKRTGANMPWAEDHFQERVSGKPLNPPPSEAWWPYARQGNAEHKADEKFSHTYPERFWPVHAGDVCFRCEFRLKEELEEEGHIHIAHRGIRYRYGDLADVVNLLINDPSTRQAYLPVWFPEDTGAIEGQRVPCTLGYHFLQRNGVMDIEYHIRSCDFMRHWRDDVYMAIRLLQWVCREVGGHIAPGAFIMNIGSLHIFEADRQLLQMQTDALKKKAEQERFARISGAL